jgi:hypothetical protein
MWMLVHMRGVEGKFAIVGSAFRRRAEDRVGF